MSADNNNNNNPWADFVDGHADLDAGLSEGYVDKAMLLGEVLAFFENGDADGLSPADRNNVLLFAHRLHAELAIEVGERNAA